MDASEQLSERAVGKDVSNTRCVQKTKDNDIKKEHERSVMMCVRKPLNVQDARVHAEFRRKHLERSKENSPIRQCFSPETLELSRKRVILTKETKVGISVLPPKRQRIGDFQVSRVRTASSSSGSRSSHAKREQLQRLKHLSKNLNNRNSMSLILPNHGISNDREKVVNIGETNERTAVFLVSIKDFPHREWKLSGYNTEMLRKIMLLSESRTIPVTSLKNNQQIVLKIAEKPNDTHTANEIQRHVNQRSLLHGILRSPFTISFKVASAVIKWILGS